jgi:3-hydroxybutyrate dehydrogenase
MTEHVLQDKVAVVTGGTGGIGLAIAERLAADGARVAIGGTRTEAGKAIAQRLGGLFVPGNLARRADCRALIDRAAQAYGTVHILVNNAGFQHIDPIEAFPEDTWDEMLAVMLTAPFLLARYAWPMMKAQGWGRVINIASTQGMVASPFKTAYAAAKHGLIGFTRAAALEGGAYGITVNAICPAYVRTSMTENQIADQARTLHIAPEEVIAKVMLEPAAIKRLVEPEEIAAVAAFLCTEQAGPVTGAAWTVDLGWTAR